MYFWQSCSPSCISLLCSEAELQFSEDPLLSKPWELAQAKCDKNGRRLEGPREEQRQQQDVIVALYTDSCHRVAWSWETDSSAKTAAPAPRLHGWSLFVLLLVRFTSAAWGLLYQIFSMALDKRWLFPRWLIGNSRRESPYKCSRAGQSTDLRQDRPPIFSNNLCEKREF